MTTAIIDDLWIKQLPDTERRVRMEAEAEIIQDEDSLAEKFTIQLDLNNSNADSIDNTLCRRE